MFYECVVHMDWHPSPFCWQLFSMLEKWTAATGECGHRDRSEGSVPVKVEAKRESSEGFMKEASKSFTQSRLWELQEKAGGSDRAAKTKSGPRTAGECVESGHDRCFCQGSNGRRFVGSGADASSPLPSSRQAVMWG